MKLAAGWGEFYLGVTPPFRLALRAALTDLPSRGE
jgi:hypothetical protein